HPRSAWRQSPVLTSTFDVRRSTFHPMALAESLVKERFTTNPQRYASRVRWLALIYSALNLLSFGIMIAIAWRVQFFVSLTQRSNVETLVLAIIFILALYYPITSFGGLIGAIRMAWL